MRLIPLTQGKFAMVDNADYEAVSQFKWHAEKGRHGFYAVRNIIRADGKKRIQYLHQFLMPGVPQIDHRDGNGLNNQRCNIRPATHQLNGRGFRSKEFGATSQFRGVSWNQKRQKWETQIFVAGKRVFLGYFTDEIESAIARDKATLKYYGPDAQFNFPI